MYTVLCGWRVVLAKTPQITLSHEHTKSAWVETTHFNDYDFGGQAGDFIKDIIASATS